MAIVFLFGTAAVYLALTGEARHWRRLKPFSGFLLFLAIAAPWHILAGLRNTGGMDGHGFFWFYFINEHILRFLGQRIPRDYNKLPGYLYWSLHLVWLFPWSLFLPLFFVDATRRWRRYGLIHPDKLYFSTPWIFGAFFLIAIALTGPGKGFAAALPLACLVAWAAWRNRRIGPWYTRNPQPLADLTQVQKSSLLLAIFSFLVLAFFSLSTNQEYYTFPAYLPMLMLLAAALGRAEAAYSGFDPLARSSRRWITFAHAAFTTIGLLIAAALSYGLWISRHLATLPNVGDLLAHRGVGDYTLSMSSLFDLTGPSFAALRLPAGLAMAAFAAGPAIAWMLRARRRHLAATTAIALTSAVFLIAAHIAFARFAPMLSSQDFAAAHPAASKLPGKSPATTPCCFTVTRPTAPPSPSISIARSTSPPCWSMADPAPCSSAQPSRTRNPSSSRPRNSPPNGEPVNVKSCSFRSSAAPTSTGCSARVKLFWKRLPAKPLSRTDHSTADCHGNPPRRHAKLGESHSPDVTQATLHIEPPLSATQPAAHRWNPRSVGLIVLAWLVLHIGGLFTPGLLDDVDSVYLEIAREMLRRHNYVTPYIDGIRFFDKPPLMYWLAAGSFHLFGVHDWAGRLPLALLTLALLLATYALGLRLFASVSPAAHPDRAALYSALALATSIGPYLYTRFYIPDIVVALWMTLAVHTFLVALDRIKPRSTGHETPGAPSMSRSHRDMGGS